MPRRPARRLAPARRCLSSAGASADAPAPDTNPGLFRQHTLFGHFCIGLSCMP